jgi:hypothetical protein
MDGIPDFADMAYMMPLTKEQYRPRFVPIVLQLPTYIDITRATIKLEYSGSDPNQVGGPTDQNPNAQYIAAPGVLRVWRTSSFSTRSPVTDYIVPGQTYSATELGFTVDRGFIVLYVEGVRQSTTVSDQLIRLVVDVS